MKFIHIKTFLVTLLILTIALFVFVKLRLKMGLDCHMKRFCTRKYLKCANTGDLIAVAYGSKRAKLVKVFTGSMWAHAAVIIHVRGNDAHVVEAARYSETKSGILATPLKKWLHHNRNYIVAYRPYRGCGFEMDSLKNFMETHESAKIDMFVGNWLKSMYKLRHDGSRGPKEKYYCSEFVAHLLQELNVIKRKYLPAGYKPWELLYDDLPLKTGHYYDEPRLLINEN
jgi:hypothetical protein